MALSNQPFKPPHREPTPGTPSPPPPKSRRGALLFGAKAIVATVLITWLIRSGALDVRALGTFWTRPELLAMDIAMFFGAALFATLRWRALLQVADVRPRFARLLQLQVVAFFFNVVIPGNVGGDVVKALYVARDQPASKRTTILLIVFIERLMGLAGLVTMATAIALVRGRQLWDDPLLRPLAGTVLLLGVGVVVGPVLFVLFMRYAGPRMEVWTSGPSGIAKLLSSLVAATRLLAANPGALLRALVFSMGIHGLAMGFFTILTRVITGQDAAYAQIATVFPLGILTMVLPISPAGLGVGHMAFERLFAAIGLTGGATVFNVFLIGQIAPYLLGAVPYLALKREGRVADIER